MNIKAYKGNIIFTQSLEKFTILENGYVVVKDDKVVDIFEKLPTEYKDAKVVDYGDNLIIPGFADTHLHASQYANRGIGLDKELLPWLDTYTFPEEATTLFVEAEKHAKERYDNYRRMTEQKY